MLNLTGDSDRYLSRDLLDCVHSSPTVFDNEILKDSRMSPCEDCHAGCCRSFVVPVSGADIMRIEHGLGLSFWDFVCRWEDPDGRIALNYAPHFFFEDEPETQFVISLMHHESEYFKETNRCRFLTEGAPDEEHPLGQARCGIYNYRPGACRVFPTKFDPANELAVIHDIPDRSRDGDVGVYDLCPRPWEPSDLDPVQPLHNLVVARYEMQFFRSIAELWNRNPRSWSVFPDFLRLVYARRVVREEELKPQQTVTELAPAEVVDDRENPSVVPFAISEEQRRSA